jgi:hypothetical protein
LQIPRAGTGAFRFDGPRIPVGLDVCNASAAEATVTVRTPELREVTFKIRPGEPRPLRTGWQNPSSEAGFNFTNGEGLILDQVAYRLTSPSASLPMPRCLARKGKSSTTSIEPRTRW